MFLQLSGHPMRMLPVVLFFMSFASLTLHATAKPPIVIAHRGASGYLPEHTLAAVTAAHLMRADFIEQDVVLSKDNVAVVLHDIHLESTTDVSDKYPHRKRTDGHFYAIDFTLAELKSLDVTERREASGDAVFSARFPVAMTGLKIPTLEEEIVFIRGLNETREHTAGWYIELKKPAFHTNEGYDIAKVTLDILNRHGLNRPGAPVFLQCFDLNTLRYLRKELGTPLPLIMLLGDNAWAEAATMDYDWLRTDSGLAAIEEVANGVGPWIAQLIDPAKAYANLVARAHAQGLLVHPYTVRQDALPKPFSTLNALHEYLFVDLGVDGVFSDFPDKTHHFITTNASRLNQPLNPNLQEHPNRD